MWDSNLNKPDALVCRQVEFGAHQVNLVRTQDSVNELPDELKKSKAVNHDRPAGKRGQCLTTSF